jgi:methylated-DNA-[protein]-cysteine S-methyltransferase
MSGEFFKVQLKKIESPLGTLFLVGREKRLLGVVFEKNWVTFKKRFESLEEKETPVLKSTAKQLKEYFSGKRNTFDVPFELEGTEFQKKVWLSLAKIPFGKTRSYKEQAIMVKSPKAVRAVGSANGMNPICIILPCHRVIGSDGSLTGYGGGVEKKRFLLELEGIGG